MLTQLRNPFGLSDLDAKALRTTLLRKVERRPRGFPDDWRPWLARERPYFLPGSCFNRGILQMVTSGPQKMMVGRRSFPFWNGPFEKGTFVSLRGPDNFQATTFNLTRLITMKPWSIMVHTDKWTQMACHSTKKVLLNEMSCFRISCLEKINPWKVNFHGFYGSNPTV